MKKFLSNRWPLWTLVTIAALLTLIIISEPMQQADGFLSKSTAGWVYELSPGESQVLTWTLTNTEDVAIDIEFRGEGQGSELFVFEELVTMEPKERRSFEFIVVIPKDHPDNIEYRPVLFALEKAKRDSEGGAAVLINYQMSAKPVIKIGDNPVFTPEPIPIVEEEPESIIEERPVEEDFTVTPTETLEEKLARINAANQGNIKDEPKIAQESITPQITTLDSEPIMDPEPISENIVEPTPDKKQDCDFWCWLFSLFGF